MLYLHAFTEVILLCKFSGAPSHHLPTLVILPVTLQRDNHLLSGHALLLKVKPSLNILKTFPDDLGIWSGYIFAFCECLWQEIHVNNFTDFVVLEVTAKDELGTDAVGNIVRWMPACGNEFVAVALEEGVCTGFEHSIDADAVEYAGNSFYP